MWRWVLSTAAFVLAASGGAQAQSLPISLWASIDDQTDQEKFVVRIAPQGAEIFGVVEKILDPKGQNAKCIKCPEPMKGQPILGMTILRRLASRAGDPRVWTGSEILDPENGHFYNVQLKVINSGKNLEVRGYIGMSMFGRPRVRFNVRGAVTPPPSPHPSHRKARGYWLVLAPSPPGRGLG